MIALAMLVVVALAALFVGLRYLASWNIPGNALSGVYAFTGRINGSLSGAVRGWAGTDDAERLRVENSRLRMELAALQDVAEENVFLRTVAELPPRPEFRAVTGRIFSNAVAGSAVQVTLNVGERDGVTPASTVMTESGALLGFVRDVRERSSTVVVVGDPSLQVTGRIPETEIGGLVRVDGAGRVALDLIAKGETVSEGDVVVTSGLDHAPAGLIIGTVRSVDPESTTLFQQIRLDVAHETDVVWRVLVLIP